MSELNGPFEDGEAARIDGRREADETAESKSQIMAQGSAPRPTLPRGRRAESPPPLVLTERDRALLEDVWRFGILATSHLEMLRGHDPDLALRFVSRLTLTRRLKLLFHHAYLRRIIRPLAAGSQEFLYVLDHEGARELSLRHGDVRAKSPSRLPKAMALEHMLGILDVRVALATGNASFLGQNFSEAGCELVEWRSGNDVRFTVSLEAVGERRKDVTLIPDAAFVIRRQVKRYYFFLEVDRGTETIVVLRDKIRAYVNYLVKGQFAKDWNTHPQLAFAVLFVVPTIRRGETISKILDEKAKQTESENLTKERELMRRIVRIIYIENVFARLKSQGT